MPQSGIPDFFTVHYSLFTSKNPGWEIGFSEKREEIVLNICRRAAYQTSSLFTIRYSLPKNPGWEIRFSEK